MHALAIALTLLAADGSATQGKPVSLCRNGGFDRAAGWRRHQARLVGEGNPGPCVRFDDGGSARQDVLIVRASQTLTAAVDLKTEGVRPESGRPGYAYAAVYQLGPRGRLVAHRDFVQATGTHPWRRRHFTFTVHPRARFVSLRCGLLQAAGVAWLDNWTLVAGAQPRRLDEVTGEVSRRARASAAILHEPDLPVTGAPSEPRTLARILEGAGIRTRLVSADGLADPSVLSPSRFDLLVLPTGRSFPAVARLSVVQFLRSGGRLIATGGYAFDNLLVRHKDTWRREEEVLRERVDDATSRAKSLIPDGGFEVTTRAPTGGRELDGRWRRNAATCTVVGQEGQRCVRVVAGPDRAEAETKFWLDLRAKPGASYRIAGRLRTRDVRGRGFAYMAAYQYDRDGKLLEFRDFATGRGTADWRTHTYTLTGADACHRIHVKLGLYRATGTAWFDDIRLGDVTGLEWTPMNTATGEPKDGLVTTPEQMGLFDSSFPLKRVCGLRAASGQHVVAPETMVNSKLKGWAAAGVCGSDNARWVPLLQTFDRYGRPRGAAGAMLLHYNGFYDGSAWAYFGVENTDLFGDPNGPMAVALQRVATFLVRGVFLHNLVTNERLYRDGEPVRISVAVRNQGSAPQRAAVRFRADGRTVAEPAVTLEPGADVRVQATFAPDTFGSDLCKVTALLLVDGAPVDETATGFVVERQAVMQAAAPSRFVGNYFTQGGRPQFLFGSDTYSYTYRSAHENPLTWSQDHLAARDIGLNLYENLQYNNNPTYRLAEADWRAFRGMAQLTQKHNLVFMPGMLIGQNVAIGDDVLARQKALCDGYARRLAETPALHYYVNGDYKAWPKAFPDSVWNDWLRDRYGTTEKLKAAWGAEAVRGELGRLAYPPPDSGRWDDVAMIDKARFACWLTRRWNRAHVAAVRRHDTRHPIMSEYYSNASGALDIHMTIDGQDVSDFGFFDAPGRDLDVLPLKIRWNDLRARGKGVCLGEYGVKTHPAWTVANGARHYHIVRTEEQQKQLFLAVGHYALGLGACKVQNWCLRDSQARVFPWGLFYPNQLIPKDVAYAHRNQSIVWRHFEPRYAPPVLTVCLANHMRLGADGRLGMDAALRAFADLLALHVEFNTLDDHHLDALPEATRVMIYPTPFAVRDNAYQRLLAWVRAGGRLLVTGDVSYDANRQCTRRARLRELIGVEFGEALHPNVQRYAGTDMTVVSNVPGLAGKRVRPAIACRAAGARVLAAAGRGVPVLTRRRVGRGEVTWFADAIELAETDQAQAIRRALYASFLAGAGVRPLPVEPDEPWLHAMAQRTRAGTVHVVYNTRREKGQADVTLPTRAGRVRLRTRNRWPALAAVTDDGRLVAASAYGEAAVDGGRVMAGQGLRVLLSLDGRDLRASQAILVGPFDAGRLGLPARAGKRVAAVGEFRGGQWTTLERLPLGPGAVSIDIDADRATCLILICEASRQAHWAARLTQAMTRPETIKGY